MSLAYHLENMLQQEVVSHFESTTSGVSDTISEGPLRKKWYHVEDVLRHLSQLPNHLGEMWRSNVRWSMDLSWPLASSLLSWLLCSLPHRMRRNTLLIREILKCTALSVVHFYSLLIVGPPHVRSSTPCVQQVQTY